MCGRCTEAWEGSGLETVPCRGCRTPVEIEADDPGPVWCPACQKQAMRAAEKRKGAA